MTLPIRTAHDGLELPAIGFGTYRVQGLTSSPPSGMPSRTATASAPPGRFGEVVPVAASAPGRFGETVPKATRIPWPESKSFPLSRFVAPPLE